MTIFERPKTRLVQLSNFEQLAISSVTKFKVYSGATSTQLAFWNELLSEVLVFPFDSKAVHIAVEIQNNLKKQRMSINKTDLFIAATAVANRLRLDTLNRKHFDKIEQLTLVDNSGG